MRDRDRKRGMEQYLLISVVRLFIPCPAAPPLWSAAIVTQLQGLNHTPRIRSPRVPIGWMLAGGEAGRWRMGKGEGRMACQTWGDELLLLGGCVEMI